ncbi:MAG: zinc-binding dehydrogenase [Saprospiraceae bacterium]|nr:zinc-binding dehydrogenase [Saprospiraceae bacterium]
MHALILSASHAPLEYSSIDQPTQSVDYETVELHAAALNHRDVFIQQGLYAGIKFPCVLGSDGAGFVNSQAVIIYPALDWGDSPSFQGKNFRVLGMPDQGTFAEYIAVPRENLFPKPSHLSWHEAAALPLAGLTAWRTLFSRCMVKKGEKVLITGIGGGVALMAAQFAVAVGATVYVTTGSEEKLFNAAALNIAGGVNYHDDDWDKQLKQSAGGFDVIIDSAGGDGFARFPAICNPGARIGFYGASLGKVNGLSLQPVFWKQISLLGSTMGSPEEFKQMLDFVEAHQIRPIIDEVFSLERGNEAFAKMEKGKQFGKLVLSIKK